jgi:outer membrane lipoprotein carrier protein
LAINKVQRNFARFLQSKKPDMTTRIFTLIAAILFSFSIGAQAQDAKAKSILDAVSSNLKTLKSLKANFTLSVSKTKEKKSGTVSMKGTKYFINMGTQEIYCDAKTIYTFNKTANEVTINDIDPNENTLSPTKLFTNFYDKEFTSKFISEKKVGTSTIATIMLTPTKARQFTKVELTVDVTKKIITGGKVYEKNGNVMSYTISGFTSNPTLADNIFVWDSKKHPKVEVVDLR